MGKKKVKKVARSSTKSPEAQGLVFVPEDKPNYADSELTDEQRLDVLQLVHTLQDKRGIILAKRAICDDSETKVFRSKKLVEQIVGNLTTLEDVLSFYTAFKYSIEWDILNPELLKSTDLQIFETDGVWSYQISKGKEVVPVKRLTTYLVNQSKKLYFESERVNNFDVDQKGKYAKVFEKPVFEPQDITIILMCQNVTTINLNSFAIDAYIAHIFLASMGMPIWKSMQHLILEDVHQAANTPSYLRLSDVGYLKTRFLPDIVMFAIFSAEQLETLSWSAMFISDRMTRLMEYQLLTLKQWKKLKEISLTNLITQERNEKLLDEVFIGLLKINMKNDLTLTLSLQRHTYGTTLLRKLEAAKIKLHKINLIINENALNRETITLITKLQNLCTHMTLTFHETIMVFPTDREDRVRMMSQEFEKWDKVNEVLIGKDMYFFKIGKPPVDCLMDVFANLPLLPNLKTLRFEDRLTHESFSVFAKKILSELELEEFSIKYFDLDYEKEKTISTGYFLLNLPKTIKNLGLFPFPIDQYTLGAVVSACPKLERFTLFCDTDQNVQHIQKFLRMHYPPSTVVEVRTGPVKICHRLVAISHFLDNEPRQESFVF
ncbi:unnamed protein product [Caenorhabditis sp. 36 PRJEB53466]|nr:unnamed protein product [Caenorhabditis sp. 36 PRJEB53466]